MSQVNQAVEAPEPVDHMQEVVEDYKAAILSLFETWPYLSRTFIQVGLGPASPPKLWGPILDGLVEENLLCVKQVAVTTPKGRNLTRVVYHTPAMPYPPISFEGLRELQGTQAAMKESEVPST